MMSPDTKIKDAELKEVIVAVSGRGLSTDDINDATDLISDLSLDSVSLMQLIVEIETRFGFIFEDSMLDFEAITEYAKLKAYVEACRESV